MIRGGHPACGLGEVLRILTVKHCPCNETGTCASGLEPKQWKET
jgi:hypothetical protein